MQDGLEEPMAASIPCTADKGKKSTSLPNFKTPKFKTPNFSVPQSMRRQGCKLREAEGNKNNIPFMVFYYRIFECTLF